MSLRLQPINPPTHPPPFIGFLSQARTCRYNRTPIAAAFTPPPSIIVHVVHRVHTGSPDKKGPHLCPGGWRGMLRCSIQRLLALTARPLPPPPTPNQKPYCLPPEIDDRFVVAAIFLHATCLGPPVHLRACPSQYSSRGDSYSRHPRANRAHTQPSIFRSIIDSMRRSSAQQFRPQSATSKISQTQKQGGERERYSFGLFCSPPQPPPPEIGARGQCCCGGQTAHTTHRNTLSFPLSLPLSRHNIGRSTQ